MKGRFYIIIVFLSLASIAIAQTNTIVSNASTDWALVLEQQARLHETAVTSQQIVANAAITSVKDSFQHLVTTAYFISIVVTIFATLFGGIAYLAFRSSLKHIENLHNEAAKELGNTKIIRDNFVKSSNEELEKFSNKLKSLEKDFSSCNESLAQAISSAKLANEIARLNINDSHQKLLAVTAIAQSKNSLAIPVLIDVLRDKKRPLELLVEALYGLGRFGSSIPNEQENNYLIIESSKHEGKQVRLAAVEAMGKIDPKNAGFQIRLAEIINNDVDNDVILAARKVLENAEA